MSNKKGRHEEHVDETWLIPYADILTLLLALFIVMFASSQVNKDKFNEMKTQFNNIFSGGSGIFEGTLNNPAAPDGINTSDTSPTAAESEMINDIKKLLDDHINKAGFSEQINTKVYKEGLEISIQDAVLFDSGNANIRADVTQILSTIAKILTDIDNDIRVVGHTDNVPIKNSEFESNWELSVRRSINVMNYLIRSGSLNPERFVVQGYGEYKPKFSNSTEAGRAKNRRVEVVILRNHPVSDTEEGSEQKTSGSN